jgi:hypothetical protein
VQEKEGDTVELVGIGKDFFNRMQMAQQLRKKTGNWDYMKCTSLTIQEKWSPD